MTEFLQQASRSARQAVQAKNWPQVKALARDILSRQRDSAEGYFLLGMAEGAANRDEQAIKAFERAIRFDSQRYDAAVELAAQRMKSNACGAAVELLARYEVQLMKSPRYLELAATIYADAGLPHKAWPLYQRANELQPNVRSLQAKYAACSVFVGKIAQAKEIYRQLLRAAPGHQRNHYELARLGTATDTDHIDEMLATLAASNASPEKNIYVYYALGKEYEDLERWQEAFKFYKKAGDAARSVADYDVANDIAVIDKVIDVCNAKWIDERSGDYIREVDAKTPIFVVGLPRTGTTLLERILSSHSSVETVGESYFIESAIRQLSRAPTLQSMSPAIVTAAASKDALRIRSSYLQAIKYKFGSKPFFVEKFPENFLYLGFIAKAFPDAHIIYVTRNPMDSCFALYKQSFFRYAYSLDDLGSYYEAHHRLSEHWREVLGDRLIEIGYESLIKDQRGETERLLDQIGLPFENACLSFENNKNASNTASTVQIREKMHNRSVDRWVRYRSQLEPLRTFLEAAGIDVTSYSC